MTRLSSMPNDLEDVGPHSRSGAQPAARKTEGAAGFVLPQRLHARPGRGRAQVAGGDGPQPAGAGARAAAGAADPARVCAHGGDSGRISRPVAAAVHGFGTPCPRAVDRAGGEPVRTGRHGRHGRSCARFILLRVGHDPRSRSAHHHGFLSDQDVWRRADLGRACGGQLRRRRLGAGTAPAGFVCPANPAATSGRSTAGAGTTRHGPVARPRLLPPPRLRPCITRSFPPTCPIHRDSAGWRIALRRLSASSTCCSSSGSATSIPRCILRKDDSGNQSLPNRQVLQPVSPVPPATQPPPLPPPTAPAENVAKLPPQPAQRQELSPFDSAPSPSSGGHNRHGPTAASSGHAGACPQPLRLRRLRGRIRLLRYSLLPRAGGRPTARSNRSRSAARPSRYRLTLPWIPSGPPGLKAIAVRAHLRIEPRRTRSRPSLALRSAVVNVPLDSSRRRRSRQRSMRPHLTRFDCSWAGSRALSMS